MAFALLLMVIALAAPAAASADANLSVSKVDSPDPVEPGQNITYTITVTNSGPTDAANVTLTDVLPASTTFVTYSAPVGWTNTTPAVGGTGTVTSSIANLPNGSSAVFTLVVNVNPNTPPSSTIDNTATVSSSTTEANPGDESATESTLVTGADLAVLKDDNADPVRPGDNITYTINVSNSGPAEAQNPQLDDTLPSGTTFVSFTAPPGWSATTPAVGGTGTVTATAASLPSEDAAQFTLVVKVDPGVAHGTVVNNTASVSSSTGDANSANNSDTEATEVNEIADLAVGKSASSSTIAPGGDLTYTLDLANSGPGTAEQVSLTDAVPAGTTFVSATQVAGPSFTLTTPAAGGGGTFTATRSTLANGASAQFRMVVRVDGSAADGSKITNTASSDQFTHDPNASNDSASTNTTVSNPPAVESGPAPAGPQMRPPRLTIGDARMRVGSGVVFVPLTCEFSPRDVCITDVTLTFNTVFHKLDPITVRDVHIGGGQSLDLYMAAPKAQRRKMRRIGTMPVTVTATNPPAADVVKQGLLKGLPRSER